MHPEFLGTHRTNWAGNLGAVPLPPRICRTPGAPQPHSPAELCLPVYQLLCQ